jgi:hypothetical protein
MSTEFGDTAAAIEEVAIGAAKVAREVASDPVGSARKQVKGFERKGAGAAHRINRRFNSRLRALRPEKVHVWGLELNGKLPENAAVKGLHLVKIQARRHDGRGQFAKRALHILNVSFKTIARVATRFEEETEVTVRHHAPVTRASRKRATSRSAVRRAA